MTVVSTVDLINPGRPDVEIYSNDAQSIEVLVAESINLDMNLGCVQMVCPGSSKTTA